MNPDRSIFIFISFVLLTVTKSSFGALPRASVGETCDKDIRCDSRGLLTCSNGTCQCIKRTEMTYDTYKGKCVVLSGERCSYTAIEIQGDHEEKRYAEKLDCVENCICKPDGYCGCTEEFYESSNGTCIPKLSYSKNCSKHAECNQKQNLICSKDGQCSCNETEALYDIQWNRCVAKVGLGVSSAKYGGYCVPHAILKFEGGVYFCACKDDYMETLERTCTPKHDFGENCTKTEECNPLKNLFCVDGQCKCNGSDWLYDARIGRCLIKTGYHCVRGAQRFEDSCVLNAQCQQFDDMSSSNCICNHEFSSKNGLCHGNYGTHECDPLYSPCVDGLLCNDNKCTCPFPNYQIWDERSKKCLSLLHGPCSETTIDRKTVNFSCSTNMECRKDNGISECLCAKGYIESSKGKTCTGMYGTPCKATQECDEMAGLVCRNRTCTCKDFEEYDVDFATCKALVGGKCGHVEGRDVACTMNAKCVPARNKDLPGTCGCSNVSSQLSTGLDRKCKNGTSERSREG